MLHPLSSRLPSSLVFLIACLPSSRTHSILLHCLSFKLAALSLSSLLFTAASWALPPFSSSYCTLPRPQLRPTVADSLINPPCIANMNSHWQALSALLFPLLFVPTPTTSPAQCNGRFASFIANIMTGFPYITTPLALCASYQTSSVRSYSRCLPG
jgi:hypothetical protein